ncbi:site-specific integrase [Amycolatopsis palatopharyngis]|uniref:site-specific integrase n=1 Tax=Amycolatopsis palatopharyngis TaxID=187982 RepID=UPI000E2879DB|nr:site-specific integrase [Amycolatopsis palatopharyngis]
MARPPLPLGTWGQIRTVAQAPGPGRACETRHGRRPWRAYAQYRGENGRTRQVCRTGTSEAHAVHRLRTELSQRAKTTIDIDLSPTSRVEKAAALWLDRVARRVRTTTYHHYRRQLRNHVLPALGQLLLRECTVPRLERFLDTLADVHGFAPETRRGIRTVLSGVLQLAVRHGVLPHNPVRDLEPIVGGPVRTRQTFTPEQARKFLDAVDTDHHATRTDVADLLQVLFGTGTRLGEALALRWRGVNLTDHPITVDGQLLPARSVWIRATLAYEPGTGPVQHDPKTPTAHRILPLPDSLRARLAARKGTQLNGDGPVFPSASGTWRYPSTVQAALRQLRGRLGYPHFTTHVARRTVATTLDHAGQTARQIADHLGHAQPAFTQNHYLGRQHPNPTAAHILEHPAPPTGHHQNEHDAKATTSCRRQCHANPPAARPRWPTAGATTRNHPKNVRRSVPPSNAAVVPNHTDVELGPGKMRSLTATNMFCVPTVQAD